MQMIMIKMTTNLTATMMISMTKRWNRCNDGDAGTDHYNINDQENDQCHDQNENKDDNELWKWQLKWWQPWSK